MELKQRIELPEDWLLNVPSPLQTDQSRDELRVVSGDILETFEHQRLQTYTSKISDSQH